MLHKIPSMFPWKHNKTKIMAEPVLVEEVDVNLEDQLAPCGICGRTFLPGPLSKHVRICERNATKKRKVFNSLKQRVEGTDLAPFHQRSYLKKGDPPTLTDTKIAKNSWKEKHQQLVNAIRAAKGVTEVSVVATPSNKMLAVSSGFERCPSCDRNFGPKAFDRHVEWCKERKARLPQSPANIQQAKERLEARIKYRVPPLNKPKKTIKEKYQSPLKVEAVRSAGNLERKPSVRKVTGGSSVSVKKSSEKIPDSPSVGKLKVDTPKGNKRPPPHTKLNTPLVNCLENGLTVSQLNTPILAPKKLVTWSDNLARPVDIITTVSATTLRPHKVSTATKAKSEADISRNEDFIQFEGKDSLKDSARNTRRMQELGQYKYSLPSEDETSDSIPVTQKSPRENLHNLFSEELIEIHGTGGDNDYEIDSHRCKIDYESPDDALDSNSPFGDADSTEIEPKQILVKEAKKSNQIINLENPQNLNVYYCTTSIQDNNVTTDIAENELNSDTPIDLTQSKKDTTLPIDLTKTNDKGPVLKPIPSDYLSLEAITQKYSEFIAKPSTSFAEHDFESIVTEGYKAVDLAETRISLEEKLIDDNTCKINDQLATPNVALMETFDAEAQAEWSSDVKTQMEIDMEILLDTPISERADSPRIIESKCEEKIEDVETKNQGTSPLGSPHEKETEVPPVRVVESKAYPVIKTPSKHILKLTPRLKVKDQATSFSSKFNRGTEGSNSKDSTVRSVGKNQSTSPLQTPSSIVTSQEVIHKVKPVKPKVTEKRVTTCTKRRDYKSSNSASPRRNVEPKPRRKYASSMNDATSPPRHAQLNILDSPSLLVSDLQEIERKQSFDLKKYCSEVPRRGKKTVPLKRNSPRKKLPSTSLTFEVIKPEPDPKKSSPRTKQKLINFKPNLSHGYRCPNTSASDREKVTQATQYCVPLTTSNYSFTELIEPSDPNCHMGGDGDVVKTSKTVENQWNLPLSEEDSILTAVRNFPNEEAGLQVTNYATDDETVSIFIQETIKEGKNKETIFTEDIQISKQIVVKEQQFDDNLSDKLELQLKKDEDSMPIILQRVEQDNEQIPIMLKNSPAAPQYMLLLAPDGGAPLDFMILVPQPPHTSEEYRIESASSKFSIETQIVEIKPSDVEMEDSATSKTDSGIERDVISVAPKDELIIEEVQEEEEDEEEEEEKESKPIEIVPVVEVKEDKISEIEELKIQYNIYGIEDGDGDKNVEEEQVEYTFTNESKEHEESNKGSTLDLISLMDDESETCYVISEVKRNCMGGDATEKEASEKSGYSLSDSSSEFKKASAKYSFEKLHNDNIDCVIFSKDETQSLADIESFSGNYSEGYSNVMSKARLERELRSCCSDVALVRSNDSLNFTTYSETDLLKFTRLQSCMKDKNEERRNWSDKILEIAGAQFLSNLKRNEPETEEEDSKVFSTEIYENCLSANIKKIKSRQNEDVTVRNNMLSKLEASRISVISEETNQMHSVSTSRTSSGHSNAESPRFLRVLENIFDKTRPGSMVSLSRNDCWRLMKLNPKRLPKSKLKLPSINDSDCKLAHAKIAREKLVLPNIHPDGDHTRVLMSAYNPLLTAEKQLRELLECDDFKPFKQSKPISKTVDPRTKRVDNKRASVIDPPGDFRDDPDDDFELIENFINDNLNNDELLDKLDLDTISLRGKVSHFYDDIDPRLINECDNLSIPEHLIPANVSPPPATLPQINANRPKTSVATARKKSCSSSSTSTRSNCSFPRTPSPHERKKNLSSLKRSMSILDPAKPKNLKNKEDVQNYFHEQEMKSPRKRQERIETQFTTADDLFSIDDEMYEEYKRYEQMYLQEKEEKSRLERKIQSEDEMNNVIKINGDSAYGSLNNRGKPKVRTKVAKLSPLEHRVDSASSSGSETCNLQPANSLVSRQSGSENSPKLSKFCHECGHRYPLSTAKFCVECGIRRLVL